MLAVPISAMHGMSGAAGDSVFLGFGRVYSGVLREGDKMYVINGAYDPSDPGEDACEEVVIEELYLMMGQGMFRVKEVPAGNVLAIGGLEKYVLKSATLSSTKMCPPFGNMMFQVAAIVKVAVEPENVSDMPALVEGLRLLNRSDAFVEVGLMETGEHVIAAAGEVHLERCIADLRERFAKVDLKVSPPLVSFRESVSSTGVAEATTSNGLLTIRATANPLPPYFPRIIEDSMETLKKVLLSAHNEQVDDADALAPEILSKLKTSRDALAVEGDGTEGDIEVILSEAWALGPKQIGPNLLTVGDTVDGETGMPLRSLGKPLVGEAFGITPTPYQYAAPDGASSTSLIDISDPTVMSTVEGNALTGFQMATLRGPLCDEPMFGVNVRLEVIPKPRQDDEEGDGGFGEEQYGPFSGQVTSATREAIRRSVLKAEPRLVEAMYLAVITTTSEALGGTYSVLGRRRAKILSESIREGTGVFIIHSYLPVAASFGFADELRHSSSGASNAQLMLSHWERLDIDPFFTPKTEEEREEFGEDGDAGPNMARQLVDATRRRKGLKVEETLVKVATKQRTLSRKA